MPRIPRLLSWLVYVVILPLQVGCGDGLGPAGAGVRSLEAEAGDRQQGPVAAALAEPLVVRATDPRGRPVAGARVEWAVTSGGGSVSAVSAATDSEGRAAATWTLGIELGEQGVSAAVGGASLLFRATARPGPPVSVSIVPAAPVLDGVGATAALAVRVLDAWGHEVSGRLPAWGTDDERVATVNASGVVTARGVGTVRVHAALGGVSGDVLVDVRVGDPDRRVSRIVAGAFHTCALDGAGAARCWGANAWGQLGNGTWDNSASPVEVAGGLRFTGLAAGAYHTCGLTAAGEVWCWGAHSNGQLGIGSAPNRLPVPVRVSGAPAFTAVTAGYFHTCALEAGGAAWCWGSNTGGQLGDGTTRSSAQPVPVTGRFSSIAAGYAHTCGLGPEGLAWCWGWNGGGQLGNGTNNNATVPGLVAGGLRYRALNPGFGHTCGLTDTGEVRCWGYVVLAESNDQILDSIEYGTLPAVVGRAPYAAIAVGGGHNCALTEAGTVECWGDNDVGQLGNGSTVDARKPVTIVPGVSFTAVAAGAAHTCGLTGSGTAWCWGSNETGQAGFPRPRTWTPAPVGGLPPAAAIQAGLDHTCALGRDGAAHCWGGALYGKLGDGSTTNRAVPAPVAGGLRFTALTAGEQHACGIDGSGSAWCWGASLLETRSSVPAVVSGFSGLAAIHGGLWHTCALDGSGAAHCWGNNSFGLGTGANFSARPAPVAGNLRFATLADGFRHTCGATAGGEAWCWGWNYYGQLGDGTDTARATPVAVQGGLSFTALATGLAHTCGLATGGAPYCWGYNSVGQLGDSRIGASTAPVAVSGGLSLVSLAAGADHTCGLDAGGAAWCWGWNWYGQLGNESWIDSATPVRAAPGLTFVALDAGDGHTCGVTGGGTVWCWGANYYGQLGRGSLGYATAPVTVVPAPAGPAAFAGAAANRPAPEIRPYRR